MDLQQNHQQMFERTPVTRLFFKCALPSIVSMAAASLYTIADGIFVGRFIGAGALAAVNLVMPLIMISFALADMIAVGSAVQIAIRLGEHKNEEASRIFTFALKMILAISVAVALLALAAAPTLVRLLGADGEVAEMAVVYMRVHAIFAPFIMSFFAIDNFLRICGKVRYSMGMNILASAANIVLDWLFIVKFEQGIGSAALASCLCLTLGNIICFVPFLAKKLVLRFAKGNLSFSQIGNIIANGSSEFFSNISTSVCMVLFNFVLMRLGEYIAVAAFSIVMYIDSIVKSIIFGMSDSIQPAISYNYGAKRIDRVFALERRGQLSGFLISLSVMIWMLTSGDIVIRLFSEQGHEELLAMSTRAMRLFSFSYLVTWTNIISSSFFTALNKPIASLSVSFSQTLLFPVICLIILPMFLGLDGVWLTELFAGGCTAILSVTIMVFTVRSLKKNIQTLVH